jgi:hypothetical protein
MQIFGAYFSEVFPLTSFEAAMITDTIPEGVCSGVTYRQLNAGAAFFLSYLNPLSGIEIHASIKNIWSTIQAVP